MIIRCDQCKTRFRLDDSKVTASGVRVRCSKCKHTFVVRKEAHEDESDIDVMISNRESSTDDALKQDDDTMGDVTERTAIEKKSDEIDFSSESISASGQELPHLTGGDNTYSVEDDFHLFKAERSDSGPASVDEEPGEEKKPFLWPAGGEAEANKEQEVDDFAIATKEGKETNDVISWGMEDFSMINEETNSLVDDSRPVDTVDGPSTETPYHFQLSETDRDQYREDFQADSGQTERADDLDEPDDFSLGNEIDIKKDNQIPAENEQPFIIPNVAETGVIGGSADLPDAQAVEKQKSELFSFASGADNEFSSPHSEDETEEVLPPLSITSRRKGTMSLPKVLAGIFSVVLIIVVAGLYFFREDFVAMDIPGFSGFKNVFMTGRLKSAEIAIKNLEGTFVRNNNGGDVFVIRGEVSNRSGKSSSAIRIQGHIYGTKGEVLSSRYAYFGKVLSNDQLSGLPVNEIETLSEGQTGSAPRDLTMHPGNRVPFQIIFLDVPEGAGEFGAEVITSTTSGP